MVRMLVKGGLVQRRARSGGSRVEGRVRIDVGVVLGDGGRVTGWHAVLEGSPRVGIGQWRRRGMRLLLEGVDEGAAITAAGGSCNGRGVRVAAC